MFHVPGSLIVSALESMRNPAAKSSFQKSERPDLRPAFAVTRYIRLHQGAQKGSATNLGSLSEPHREQYLSANPKRTAKFIRSIIQTQLVSKRFKKNFKNLNFFSPRIFASEIAVKTGDNPQLTI
jgi:hypothetical protein